jgi:hypothetical protein
VRFPALIPALLALTLAGCTGSPLTPAATDAKVQQRHQTDAIRAELELIPLPSKARYLAVHSLTIW